MGNLKLSTEVEVKECNDGSGDIYFELPPEILKELGWKEGDDVTFDVQGTGAIRIKKVKLENVDLEFGEDELLKYMLTAHERGQSFNEFCNDALVDLITKYEFESECG